MEGGVLQSRLEMSRTEIARNPKKTWEQVEQGRNKLTLRIEGGVLQSRLEMSETLEISRKPEKLNSRKKLSKDETN